MNEGSRRNRDHRSPPGNDDERDVPSFDNGQMHIASVGVTPTPPSSFSSKVTYTKGITNYNAPSFDGGDISDLYTPNTSTGSRNNILKVPPIDLTQSEKGRHRISQANTSPSFVSNNKVTITPPNYLSNSTALRTSHQTPNVTSSIPANPTVVDASGLTLAEYRRAIMDRQSTPGLTSCLQQDVVQTREAIVNIKHGSDKYDFNVIPENKTADLDHPPGKCTKVNVLMTLPIRVEDAEGREQIGLAFLDTGSQKNFVSHKFVKKLGVLPHRTEPI